MDVAVLGMGSMGRAVAVRLLEQGHQVVAWNRTPGRDGEVLEAGGRAASSPAEAADGAAAVLVSLADDAAVRSVVLGADGLAGGALGGAVLVDTSTVSPVTSRQLAAGIPDGRMLSAPIFGAPQAVRDGKATYLVAGPKDLADGLEPLWSALSPTHRWIGEDPGTATTLKLLGNYLLMTGIAALAEAVATGQAVGLDDDLLQTFLAGLPLVAPALHNRLDDLIGGDHRGWFSAVLGAKDLRLAGELAGSAGLELPLADVTRRRYEQLAERGTGDLDIAGVIELFR